MKANSTKRKIFDAVDLLTEDTSSQMPVKTMSIRERLLFLINLARLHYQLKLCYRRNIGSDGARVGGT